MNCNWKEATVMMYTWQMCLYNTIDDRIVSGTIQKTGMWEGPMVTTMLSTMRKHKHATLLDIGGNKQTL